MVVLKEKENALNLINLMDWMFVSSPNSHVEVLPQFDGISRWGL